MNIIYEMKDITSSIDVRKSDIVENSGGVADSLELKFADTEGLWSKWKPQKGHKIEVLESGFFSGLMFVDYLNQNRGSLTIKALSTPLEARTGNFKAWENIRLLDMAKEISGKYGYTVDSYDVTNHMYMRVDQIYQADFEFLAYRCMLEGYALKITNEKVVIYDEHVFELKPAVKTIYADQLDGDYEFKTISTGLYSACHITSSSTDGINSSLFVPSAAPAGPVLKPKVYTSNQGETDRFARGILRSENKKESTGRLQIEYDAGLTAGSNVNILGLGMVDGKYFIENAVHKLVDKKTVLKLRKPLEGY